MIARHTLVADSCADRTGRALRVNEAIHLRSGLATERAALIGVAVWKTEGKGVVTHRRIVRSGTPPGTLLACSGNAYGTPRVESGRMLRRDDGWTGRPSGVSQLVTVRPYSRGPCWPGCRNKRQRVSRRWIAGMRSRSHAGHRGGNHRGAEDRGVATDRCNRQDSPGGWSPRDGRRPPSHLTRAPRRGPRTAPGAQAAPPYALMRSLNMLRCWGWNGLLENALRVGEITWSTNARAHPPY
jgi:hypothetical protein